MKDYSKLTLRQLRIENKRLSRDIAYEFALARYFSRPVNSEKFEEKIKTIQKVLEERTKPKNNYDRNINK